MGQVRGQDVVRTFSEEDIEIPIYGIPLRQRVKSTLTQISALVNVGLEMWDVEIPCPVKASSTMKMTSLLLNSM